MNYVTAIVRNSSHSGAKPPALTLYETSVDDCAVPGNERRVGSACVEHPAQGRWPGLQVRVSVEDGVAGLLDEVAAEHRRG